MFKWSRAGLVAAVITPYFLCVFRHRKTWSRAHTSNNVVLHQIHDRTRGQLNETWRRFEELNVGGGGGGGVDGGWGRRERMNLSSGTKLPKTWCIDSSGILWIQANSIMIKEPASLVFPSEWERMINAPFGFVFVYPGSHIQWECLQSQLSH